MASAKDNRFHTAFKKVDARAAGNAKAAEDFEKCGIDHEHLEKDVRLHIDRKEHRLPEAAQRLREDIADLDGKIERIVDAIADHGRTASLDKTLGKLEQEQKTLEANLATTKGGKLENLPDVMSGRSRTTAPRPPSWPPAGMGSVRASSPRLKR